MLQTYLDKTTTYEKKIQKKSTINDSVPEGYMTSQAFWKEADKRIINLCKRHGVL